jgi:hypothetical protein
MLTRGILAFAYECLLLEAAPAHDLDAQAEKPPTTRLLLWEKDLSPSSWLLVLLMPLALALKSKGLLNREALPWVAERATVSAISALQQHGGCDAGAGPGLCWVHASGRSAPSWCSQGSSGQMALGALINIVQTMRVHHC